MRQITWSDLLHSLKAGYEDFLDVPTHVVLVALIYAIVCIFLITGTFHYPMLPLAFPITAGLAFVAPAAAISLYELSRCREAKLNHSLAHALTSDDGEVGSYRHGHVCDRCNALFRLLVCCSAGARPCELASLPPSDRAG